MRNLRGPDLRSRRFSKNRDLFIKRDGSGTKGVDFLPSQLDEEYYACKVLILSRSLYTNRFSELVRSAVTVNFLLDQVGLLRN